MQYQVTRSFGPFAPNDVLNQFASDDPDKPICLRVNEEKQMNFSKEDIKKRVADGFLQKMGDRGGSEANG